MSAEKIPHANPLVTIIVPVYNGESFLKETLDSILNQTYKDFEVFILDNCSTDRTADIAKEFLSDSRFHYIKNKRNLGSLGNWNEGIHLGTGEFIAIYHADDVYEKNMVKEEVAVLQKNRNVSCVFTNASLIDGKSRKTGVNKLMPALVNRPLSFLEIYTFMLNTFRSPYIAPTCMARRSAYKKAGNYDTSRFTQAGDVDMYLRLTQAGHTYLLDKPLIRYRHTDQQASIRYSTTYVKPHQLFGVIDKWLKKYHNKISPKTFVTYEAYRDWDYSVCAINILAKKNVTKKDASTARAYLRRSLTLRRVLRVNKELLLFSMTLAMLFASYLGLGKVLARKINAVRWQRHLA